MFNSRARELVIHGPTRTGKTLACLAKIHYCASTYPNTRALILRKTRESMNESVLVTWEDDILGSDHPAMQGGARRENRKSYRYPNGSEVIIGGFVQSSKDMRAKLMSTEYDIIFWAEVTEGRETEWEKLLTRLSHNKMPYQQLLGDCNPDAPSHWVFQRQFKGMEFIASRLQDNPKFYADDWTEAGREYLRTLQLLTGYTADRLVKGQWVQASGLVYDVWDEARNVTEAADYAPGTGEVVWAVDDGYSGTLDPHTGQFTAESHPRVFILAQLKPDGHIDVFAESYRVKALSDQHIDEVKSLGYPVPEYAVIGPGFAELSGRLFAAEIYPRRIQAEVEETIKTARAMIAPDANGWCKIRVHPRCKHLRAEMLSYRRDPVSGKILKEFDHGPDALRYLCHDRRRGE